MLQQKSIDTSIGKINVFIDNKSPEAIPIICLHGVYLDHLLWQNLVDKITDRTDITIDMPFHGASKDINMVWSIKSCAQMLIEILNALNIEKVYAIGHSWGSMTILEACSNNPERFVAVGLCNMPFLAADWKRKLFFKTNHLFTGLTDFYSTKAAESMLGKDSFQNKEIVTYFKNSMHKLTKVEIHLVDLYVIMCASDTSDKILNLQVPAIALIGEEDYLTKPPGLETTVVKGGHISPLEATEEVYDFACKLLSL